eukprot:m.129598 g.129598  ORF g.129598 m.129598 type:complete len:71 (+) comp13048_c0_seq12:1842-2054(+)
MGICCRRCWAVFTATTAAAIDAKQKNDPLVTSQSHTGVVVEVGAYLQLIERCLMLGLRFIFKPSLLCSRV